MATVAGLVLLMFVAVHAIAMIRSLRLPEASKREPDPDDPLTYSCTVLAGLVVGIVALFFGIDPQLLPLPQDLRELLKVAYVATYLIVGTAAWILWIVRSGNILTPIKTMALSFLGVVIPVATLFLND